MGTFSPVAGWPLPSAGDTDQVPSDLGALATAIEPTVLLKFATATARDTKIVAPVAGQECWLNSPGDYFHYTGSAWVRGRAGLGLVVASTASVVGSNTGQPVYIQSGTNVLTVGASGAVQFNYPTPFPNFVSSVVVMSGDITTQPYLFGQVFANCSLTLWYGVAYLGATALSSGSVIRCNWIAVGG